ncbi:MAG: hypothetical protein KatS3mg108_1916 [Isosphaeraceae bacterium]|jgi:proteasome lid subunit RPN8/RPN11|nr:MAG: hypothetical protein KatS3mg108_1916 [Isosphaeraceae bacterium]
MTPAQTDLLIPSSIVAAILKHCRAEAPIEACGLLGGPSALRASSHYPLRNELASEVRYLGHAQDMIEAVLTMRARNERLVAIYHSHPASPAIPSRVDLEGNQYGPVPHLIVSLAAPAPEIRAWRLESTRFEELRWREVVEPESSTQ